MCRPLGESHEEACPGGHIGPPLRDGGAFRTNGYWCRTTPFPAGRDGARPLPGESEQCGLRRGEVTPPYGSTNGPMWASAPTDRRGSYIDHLGQRRTAERLRRGCEGMGGNRGRDHPQRGQQFRAIPQSPFRRQLPLHKGALGTGDADCRVGPAGRPAMTMDFCHSEERSDVGIRPLYDGRGSRPPRSSAPTKRRDSCRNHPSQRRTAERLRRGREGWAGIGAKTIPKGGPPRDRLGSA